MTRWITFEQPFRGRTRWRSVAQALKGREGFAVYRVYGTVERPLYVGSTGNLLRRIKEHERWADWWPDVVKFTAEYYPNKTTACFAEGAAIRKYHPIHNVKGTKPVLPLDSWTLKLAEQGWPPAVAAVEALEARLAADPERRVIGLDT